MMLRMISKVLACHERMNGLSESERKVWSNQLTQLDLGHGWYHVLTDWWTWMWNCCSSVSWSC